MRNSSIFYFLTLAALLFAASVKMSASDSDHHQVEEVEEGPPATGGIREIVGFKKDPVLCSELHELGRFAVDEHNKKQNASVEYIRVLKAKEQIVEGIMYHLTVEVVEDVKKRVYEAKVWVKLWEDFKQLQEFTHLGDSICGISPSQHAAAGVSQEDNQGGDK